MCTGVETALLIASVASAGIQYQATNAATESTATSSTIGKMN
jgi:hypothetical protein